MKAICRILALTIATATFTGVPAFAQDHRDDHHDDHAQGQRDERGQDHGQDHHDNHAYVQHNDWKRGHRMNQNDWQRGERVDYRTYHLSAPRRGCEWRQVDGNFVMAAVATGLIAT